MPALLFLLCSMILLNVPHDDLVALIGNMVDNYVMDNLGTYSKNVDVAALLV